MIYEALEATADSLNDYFSNRFGQPEEKVILSNIVNQDGSPAVTETDKVLVTLVNIQEEKITAHRNTSRGIGNQSVNLYLYVMFSAYFTETNYPEALKFLSAIVSFFQGNPVMNHSNTPGLDGDIDKLVFEIVNQDLQNLSHLWGAIGGKYLPSVLYKIRMVSINEGNVSLEAPRFTGFDNNVLKP